jgi:hypothetical protein
VAAALVEGGASIAVMMPVPLSYFSPLVGGLPGAARLGMEPTYYWDALTDDALDYLNTKTPPGRTIRFASWPTSFLYLARTGRLGPGLTATTPGAAYWYVVQNRPGAMRPDERALIGREGTNCVVVSKLGVPLLWAFPLDPPT